MSKVLVAGGGGREHALAWKLAQSPEVEEVYVGPGNAGTERDFANVSGIQSVTEIEKLADFAVKQDIDFTLVGMQEALEPGIVDLFESRHRAIFGPNQITALLETSKVFNALFNDRHRIPQPGFEIFSDYSSALSYIESRNPLELVLKADGLAAGKGAVLPKTLEEARQTLYDMMVRKTFGKAGDLVVIQERLHGPELSVFVLSDGERNILLPFCRDYKRVQDGDKGPNTGGMGSYGPIELEPSLIKQIEREIVEPTVKGMAAEGMPFRGILYSGLVLTEDGPKKIEDNVRFGDPECQAQMLLIKEDLYPRLRQAYRGELTTKPLRLHKGYAVTVAVASLGYPGESRQGDEIFGLDEIPEDVHVFHAGTRYDGRRVVTSGGRVLHVAARAETIEAARAKIYAVIGEQAIHFAGMHYRTDIAEAA